MPITIRTFFDLRRDQDEASAIDQAIRAGIRVRGTNLWVLFFAIVVASVGLNVNSTAVIIGAMLISPLMGPLLGIGYGAGINDLRLIKMALRTLSFYVLVSLTTSTIYFLLSPISQAQSELISRTTPTLWDVIIAFFGGCAGIVAQTRKDISTVVPGVAIATALMPPICTAGYGLASHNWEFFGGALYLFTINAFFISLATLMFVKIIRLPQVEEQDIKIKYRSRIAIAIGTLILIAPSAILAYRLVRDQQFLSISNSLVRTLKRNAKTILLSKSIDVKGRTIELTFWGDPLKTTFTSDLKEKYDIGGFQDAKIAVSHLGSSNVDVAAIKKDLAVDKIIPEEEQGEDSNITELNVQIAKLQSDKIMQTQMLSEILVQYPAIQQISISEGELTNRNDNSTTPVLVVAEKSTPKLQSSDYRRLEAWLKFKHPKKMIIITSASEKEKNRDTTSRSRKKK